MSSASTQNALAQALQLLQHGQLEQAERIYSNILFQEPQLAEAHNGQGLVRMLRRDFHAAAASFEQAFSLRPDNAMFCNNRGIALHQLAKFDDAIAAHEQAITLNPDWPIPHVNLALLLLLKGDYPRGFSEHEWRLKVPGLRTRPQAFTQPRWDGSPLDGKRILIHPEQGFGDSIQFIRFLPQVAARGGEIVLAAPPECRELFQSLPHVSLIVSSGDPLPEFSVHCPLLSVSHVLGTTLQSVPNGIPYLKVASDRIARFAPRFSGTEQPRRIGLVWAGSGGHGADRERSVSLETLSDLLHVPDIAWISLQKGSTTPVMPPLYDWTNDLNDFSDTAGLIHHLDLIITIDSAVAHLAAAMGKPVWILIPHIPDWRWMLDREDSPWYPNVQLFRQPTAGDWKTPIDRIIAELRTGHRLD